MTPTNVPVTRSDRISIRLAQGTDLASIQSVIEAAFAAEENKLIRHLSADLFKETTRPPIKSLIAELGGKLIGYVCYSPVFLKSTYDVSGYILSPLAVSPEYQSQGVGSALINSGIDMLTKDGVGVLLVYGDPNYYQRFGFKEEIGRLFVPPYPLTYPVGWTGMTLNASQAPTHRLRLNVCLLCRNLPYGDDEVKREILSKRINSARSLDLLG